MISVAASALLVASCVATSTPESTQLPSSHPSKCRLPAIPEVHLSVGHGFPDHLSCVSSVGTMHAFMMFVDFADQPAGNNSTQNLYDFFFPNASTWYETSSYGKLTLNAAADTSQFCRMSRNASEYAWERGITYEQHKAYIHHALDAYQASDTYTDLPVADVLYIVPSRNSPAITYSPTFMGNVTTRNGIFVARKALTVGADAFETRGYKLLNHETGHVMCLADLYPATGDVGSYVGGFSIMGNIDAEYPDYLAWDKWRLGWLGDDQVECLDLEARHKGCAAYTIQPLQSVGDGTKFVVLKRSETQAMVLEVRGGGGVDDKGLAQGVVVYTVDTKVATLQGPIRLLTNRPLSLNGTSELDIPSWNVKVAITGLDGNAYSVMIRISMEYSAASVYKAVDSEQYTLN